MKEKGSKKKGFKHQNHKTSRLVDGREAKGKPARAMGKCPPDVEDEEEREVYSEYRIH